MTVFLGLLHKLGYDLSGYILSNIYLFFRALGSMVCYFTMHWSSSSLLSWQVHLLEIYIRYKQWMWSIVFILCICAQTCLIALYVLIDRQPHLRTGLKPRLFFVSVCPASWGMSLWPSSNCSITPLWQLQNHSSVTGSTYPFFKCPLLFLQVCADVFHSPVQLL